MKLNKKESEKLRKEIEGYRTEGAKIYSVIGKFVFQFEEVCQGIRNCIYSGLENNGLENIDLAKSILEHNTAYDLIRIFKSFYCDFNPGDKKGHQLICKLLNRFAKINEIRNDIIHGNLSVTYINQEGKTIAYASGQKIKATKSGIKNVLAENHLDGKKYQIGYYNEEYFKRLVIELAQIGAYFGYISFYLKKKIQIGGNLNDSHYTKWNQFNKERNNYIDNI